MSSTAESRRRQEKEWRTVVERRQDAGFVYAVKTTGVFCRPGCVSRLPRRENVLFFSTSEDALAAGFRPCKRCVPADPGKIPEKKNAAAERLRVYIEGHAERKISLAELGRQMGASPHVARRIFMEAMGVSPLSYQRGLRTAKLRAALRKGGSVTDAVYAAGYGSSSRAYSETTLGMSPGRFAKGGQGETIGFTTARTEFGWMAVGATRRGLCWLSLSGSQSEAESALREEFPLATLAPDAALGKWVELAVESVHSGKALAQKISSTELLDLRGTEFQLRVWQALREIPRGETRTYSGLAQTMGCPKSTRAVARACAQNRVSLLVPCHRVVGASGSLTGYRWGVERKRSLLAAERE